MTETSSIASVPQASSPTPANAAATLPPLEKSYESGTLDALFSDPHVLAVFGFGADAPTSNDPRYLRIALEPVEKPAPFEVWRSAGNVAFGIDRGLRWTTDGNYTVGILEIDETALGGIAAAAEAAYRRLFESLAASRTPHLLRCWNYLDAINRGDDDDERYRQFCKGRAVGMGAVLEKYPAATAIGVRDGRRVVQLYWLSARSSGEAFENPRQMSAWRYPRQYGPKAPSFARAMRSPTSKPQVFISGTAAIVGHASHHDDDFAAQLDETLTNLHSVLDAVGVSKPDHFGAESLLKVYVRRTDDADHAQRLLQTRLPAGTPLLLLQGDICRRELLVEIDGIQGA